MVIDGAIPTPHTVLLVTGVRCITDPLRPAAPIASRVVRTGPLRPLRRGSRYHGRPHAAPTGVVAALISVLSSSQHDVKPDIGQRMDKRDQQRLPDPLISVSTPLIMTVAMVLVVTRRRRR